MNINPLIFKAYDIRGTYPDEVNKDVAYVVGQAYVAHTGASSVVVGQDMRTSSPELFDALVEGLTNAGARVIDVGLVATPEFYFAAASGDYDGGIMVTASHNPAKYNGLKVVGRGAVPMGLESGLDKIRDIALRGEKVKRSKGNVIETDILGDYLNKVFSLVEPKEINTKLRAVVDTGNGMAGVVEPELWKRLGCKLTRLHFELDGTFPNHEPDPSKPQNLKDLREMVKQVKADLGIAFDGDGDRVGFVDEKGEPARGDLIVALLAPEILRKNPGLLVLADVRCSLVVKEEVEKAGGKFQYSKVGHAYVKHQMRELGAVFAGELSMHYYFRDFYVADCSDLAMLYVLKIMSERKKKLSELIVPLKRYYHSGEINFSAEGGSASGGEAWKREVMRKLEQKFASQTKNILRLDGLRLDFAGDKGEIAWWFNVRPSNTEPLLRLNLEARTKELLEEKRAELTNLIKSG